MADQQSTLGFEASSRAMGTRTGICRLKPSLAGNRENSTDVREKCPFPGHEPTRTFCPTAVHAGRVPGQPHGRRQFVRKSRCSLDGPPLGKLGLGPEWCGDVLPTSKDWRDSVGSDDAQASRLVLCFFLPSVFLSNRDQRSKQQFHPSRM